LQEHLLAYLGGQLPGQEVNADTPLLTSGLLDSVAFIDLMAWIEQEIGSAIDADAIENPLKDWNTVRDIVNFVAGRNDKAAA
jgi:acyl carrier protein